MGAAGSLSLQTSTETLLRSPRPQCVPAVNAAVYREAVARGIPTNSVDDIPNCDFFFWLGGEPRRFAKLRFSTAGESPAVAQRLRREIDEQLPQDLGPWLAELKANCGAKCWRRSAHNEERKRLCCCTSLARRQIWRVGALRRRRS